MPITSYEQSGGFGTPLHSKSEAAPVPTDLGLGEDQAFEASAKVSAGVEQANQARSMAEVGESGLLGQLAEQVRQADGEFEIGGLEIDTQMIMETVQKLAPVVLPALMVGVSATHPELAPVMAALLQSGALNSLFGAESGQTPDVQTPGVNSSVTTETANNRWTDIKEAGQNILGAGRDVVMKLIDGQEINARETANRLGHVGIDATSGVFNIKETTEQFAHGLLDRVLRTKSAPQGA